MYFSPYMRNKMFQMYCLLSFCLHILFQTAVRLFELLRCIRIEEENIKSEDVTVLDSADAWLDRETILIVIIG